MYYVALVLVMVLAVTLVAVAEVEDSRNSNNRNSTFVTLVLQSQKVPGSHKLQEHLSLGTATGCWCRMQSRVLI